MATRKNKSGKKSTRKASPWNLLVKKVYVELKKKNKNATLGDAMAEASKRRRN